MSSSPQRTLWLLRHAKAVTDPPDGGDDFDRALAPRGRRDAKALSHLIGRTGKGLDLGKVRLPEVALISPAARTVATAELVLEGLTHPPRYEFHPDLYGADPEEALTFVRALGDEVSSVMLVGHNPTAQALARGLISPDDKNGHDLVVRQGFPTCALAIFTLDLAAWPDIGIHSAHLVGLLTPPFETRDGQGQPSSRRSAASP
jgi:phosphohistidine phosphatase